LVKFVKVIWRPYVLGGRLIAFWLMEKVTVISSMPTIPLCGSADSQNGGEIAYLIVLLDALMLYTKEDGEYGPPWAPAEFTIEDGVTISEGG